MVNNFLFLSFQVDLEVTLPGEGRDRVFRVAIKWVAQVSLYALEEALEGEIFFQIPKITTGNVKKKKRSRSFYVIFFCPILHGHGPFYLLVLSGLDFVN